MEDGYTPMEINSCLNRMVIEETEALLRENGPQEKKCSNVLLLGQKRRYLLPTSLLEDDEKYTGRRTTSPSALLRIGLLSIILHVCSGFVAPSTGAAYHTAAVASTPRRCQESTLYAVKTVPQQPRVRRKLLDPPVLPSLDDTADDNGEGTSSGETDINISPRSAHEDGSTEGQDSPLPVIYDDEDDDEDENMTARRRATLARTALLGKNPGGRRSSTKQTSTKVTSVGERRVGSASMERRGTRATSRIMDTVRKTARVAAAGGANKDTGDTKDSPKTVAKLNTSLLHSIIDDILDRRRPHFSKAPATREEARLSAARSSIGRTMGILGELQVGRNDAYRQAGSSPRYPKTSSLVDDDVTVRVATPVDDVDISCLRLSVFSDISPEMQSQFCARSCQAISSRRLRGAQCVVATASRKYSETGSNILLGSAECSFHEFYATGLGQRRPQRSILYVTEVAVHPAARRQGIGARLLHAIENLAQESETETLYLHVDVSNRGAIALYEKAGYHRVDSDNPMFMEFTTSLNLHPGATRGRDHHLFAMDLQDPSWLPPGNYAHSSTVNAQTELAGNLGFVVPT